MQNEVGTRRRAFASYQLRRVAAGCASIVLCFTAERYLSAQGPLIDKSPEPVKVGEVCGAAALTLILALHGQETTVAQVDRELGSHGKLTSLLHLSDLAEAKGLRSIGIKWEERGASDCWRHGPGILQIRVGENVGHFVVMVGAINDQLVLIDPANGTATISQRVLRDLLGWNGVILHFPPKGDHYRLFAYRTATIGIVILLIGLTTDLWRRRKHLYDS